jgi:outer membrane receptor for ferrienterochelin and colicins
VAQNKSTVIKVLNANSEKPLPYCHVCFESLENGRPSYSTTNEEGIVNYPFSGKTILSISYVGYQTLIDTIEQYYPELIYRLQPGIGLEEVVITGQNKPVPIDKSIYNIKLIGREKIDQTASNNLAELLNNELNVSISNDPSTGSSLKLQGIGGENIKILVDGVPVIGRLNGNIDLSQLNLNDVGHIEIVEGPMSVLYGSNALGGVVNIITKENKYASFKAGLNTYYESVGQYNVDGNIHLKKNVHDFGLTLGRDFFSGYSEDPDARRQEWKPKEQYFGGMTYKLSMDKLTLKNKIDYFRERLLDRSNLLPVYYIEGYDTWFYTNRFNASVNGAYHFNPRNNLDVLLSYSYYSRIKEKYLKDLTTLEENLTASASDHDTSVFNAIVARGIHEFNSKSGKISFQAGIDINFEDAKGKRIENEYQEIGDYAVLGSLQWNVNPDFTVQPALRLAYNTRYNAPLVPSLNLKYQLSKTNLRLSYARGFRAPSLKELYLYFYDSNHQIEGNENLDAENSHNYNLAVNHKLNLMKRNSSIRLTGFYNQIYNKITLVQVDPDNPLHYRNENIGKYETLGATFTLAFKPFEFTDVQLGFSETGRKDDYYEQGKFVYSTNATADISFRFFRNTASFSVIYKYFGKYPVYGYNENDEVTINYIDEYHNMDITLMKDFFKRRFTLTTGIKNIFDNTEITGGGGDSGAHGSNYSSLVGWGRTVFLGLKFNITQYAN